MILSLSVKGPELPRTPGTCALARSLRAWGRRPTGSTHPKSTAHRFARFNMCICELQQVRQDEVGIIEKCGKFDEIAEPGCHVLWCSPCVFSMKGKVSTRVQQLDVKTDSKVSRAG